MKYHYTACLLGTQTMDPEPLSSPVLPSGLRATLWSQCSPQGLKQLGPEGKPHKWGRTMCFSFLLSQKSSKKTQG